jgi:hypothetical protein
MIDDLEGAAIYDGKLYLTTSQTADEGNLQSKQLFLEVSLNGEVLNSTKKLRGEILKTFKNGLLDKTEPDPNKKTVNIEDDKIEVEGLAIKDGVAYFGFKTPLVNNKAIVLSAPVGELFTEGPIKFESYLLDLNYGLFNNGIVSLEYEVECQQILVLGNNPKREEKFPVAVWKWYPERGSNVEIFNSDYIFDYETMGVTRPPKPEVLLIPKSDRLHLLFDAKNTGGQLALVRSGNTLTRIEPFKP